MMRFVVYAEGRGDFTTVVQADSHEEAAGAALREWGNVNRVVTSLVYVSKPGSYTQLKVHKRPWLERIKRFFI